LRITKIENQKKRPGRKNIYTDGKFLTGVSTETLTRLALRTGDAISPNQLNTLQTSEGLLKAKNAALRLLATRPRTEHEIRARLHRKNVPDIHIDQVTSELKAAGMLNDAEFARMYVRNALALKPSGIQRLRQKLRLLGVERETVEDALREYAQDVDLGAEAMKAARQYLQRHRSEQAAADPLRLKRKLTAFLARRGFAWDEISATVQRVLSGDPEEEHE
jgi:regulatory protein